MIVLLPIEVPNGKYCWDCVNGGPCQYFDNEGGHPTCELNMGHLEYAKDRSGVLKPSKCLKLEKKYEK